MGLETRPAPTASSLSSGPSSPADKVRFRFRKDGALRLLSHHDLMRSFERMLRRADLPYRSSQGFHPKPRLIFALSLPLGIIGLDEVAELELEEVLSIDELRERLVRQSPPGLEILSIRRIGPRDQAQVRRLCYRLTLPLERVASVRDRIAALMAASECHLERIKPTRRFVDVRPFLSDLRVVEDHAKPQAALELELWLTPAGTARPEELLALLGIQDLRDAGAVLQRAWLELHDEINAADFRTPAADVSPAAFVGTTVPRTRGQSLSSEGLA